MERCVQQQLIDVVEENVYKHLFPWKPESSTQEGLSKAGMETAVKTSRDYDICREQFPALLTKVDKMRDKQKGMANYKRTGFWKVTP